jgi:hypothetical protein
MRFVMRIVAILLGRVPEVFLEKLQCLLHVDHRMAYKIPRQAGGPGARRAAPLAACATGSRLSGVPPGAQNASGETVDPYDLRRSDATWLETAGIPRTRRRLYLGHGTRTVTDLYERHQVEAFLAEDGARLRSFIGERPTIGELPAPVFGS